MIFKNGWTPFLSFFSIWTIFKVFIEFVTILFLFLCFGFLATNMLDLSSPQSRD